MKRVYSSPDSAQIGLVQSVLDSADIAYEVRNEVVSQVAPGVMDFMPELWVLHNEDYEQARRLVLSAKTESVKTPE